LGNKEILSIYSTMLKNYAKSKEWYYYSVYIYQTLYILLFSSDYATEALSHSCVKDISEIYLYSIEK
jgi:hypothetical protein